MEWRQKHLRIVQDLLLDVQGRNHRPAATLVWPCSAPAPPPCSLFCSYSTSFLTIFLGVSKTTGRIGYWRDQRGPAGGDIISFGGQLRHIFRREGAACLGRWGCSGWPLDNRDLQTQRLLLNTKCCRGRRSQCRGRGPQNLGQKFSLILLICCMDLLVLIHGSRNSASPVGKRGQGKLTTHGIQVLEILMASSGEEFLQQTLHLSTITSHICLNLQSI